MDNLTIKWQGFRNFDMREGASIRPLTLIIGKNNVGKSSLYAPLFMLKQTLAATNPRTALLSRGSLVDIGNFQDYVKGHDSSGGVVLDVTFADRPSPVSRRGANRPARIESHFGSLNGIDAKLCSQIIYDSRGDRIVSRGRDVASTAFKVFESPVLPKSAPGRPRQEVAALKKSMREEQPVGFLFSGTGALELPQKYLDDDERWESVRDWFQGAYQLYNLQSRTRDSVRNLLNGIKYVGPLRKAALRTYRVGAESPSGVGADGEFAPELLFRSRETEVVDHLNEWLHLMGYGSIDFEDIGDDYFQMLIRGRGQDYAVNIAHMGTGVSQVLPVITQGALATAGDTLVYQQPELHLNPAQQIVVGDYLVNQVAEKKRIIVETHSEHILLRIRRRIAEGSLAAKDVAIYYVEDGEGKATSVREIDIDSVGNIEQDSWPRGFFAESLDDSFALALAQSRAKR